MELIVTALIILPACILALSRSSLLMDYAIWILALNRGVRRLVDYYVHGQFNPFSTISLTPLVVGCLLLGVGLLRISHLERRSRNVFILFAVALGLGTAVGFLNNGIGAIYALGEWISGLGAMLFAATHPRVGMGAGDRWMRTTAWAGLVVAAYGWWQYYTIPAWDAMWLTQSGMAGYMGIPEPTKMTLFSTMNERGPCAGFLGFAALPMILHKRWRILGGWIPIVFLLATMTLTGVRSMFIIVLLTAIIQPIIAKGHGVMRILAFASVLTGAAIFGLDKLPNADKFTERFSAESLGGKGSSLQGRLEIYRWSMGIIAKNPLGFGFGGSGVAASRIGGSEVSIGDAGYTQVIGQFGWLGSICFFGALYLLWRESGYRFRVLQIYRIADHDPFPAATKSLLLAMMVFLFVSDIFSGFSLIWIVFGCGVNTWTNPVHAVTFDNSEAGDSQMLAQRLYI